MNRSAATLCLVGLVLFLGGLFMMLRFMSMPLQEGMVDLTAQADAGALRDAAGPYVFCAYGLLMASGFGCLCGGVAALLGRPR
jgi:hypothetical protein